MARTIVPLQFLLFPIDWRNGIEEKTTLIKFSFGGSFMFVCDVRQAYSQHEARGNPNDVTRSHMVPVHFQYTRWPESALQGHVEQARFATPLHCLLHVCGRHFPTETWTVRR
jgi:hypothetical protein